MGIAAVILGVLGLVGVALGLPLMRPELFFGGGSLSIAAFILGFLGRESGPPAKGGMVLGLLGTVVCAGMFFLLSARVGARVGAGRGERAGGDQAGRADRAGEGAREDRGGEDRGAAAELRRERRGSSAVAGSGRVDRRARAPSVDEAHAGIAAEARSIAAGSVTWERCHRTGHVTRVQDA